jgi:hypothetical protein
MAHRSHQTRDPTCVKIGRHIILHYDSYGPISCTREASRYLVWFRSHRRLTAFNCGPMANHNLFVQLAVAMGCG